jgi:hypothetical protein
MADAALVVPVDVAKEVFTAWIDSPSRTYKPTT